MRVPGDRWHHCAMQRLQRSNFEWTFGRCRRVLAVAAVVSGARAGAADGGAADDRERPAASDDRAAPVPVSTPMPRPPPTRRIAGPAPGGADAADDRQAAARSPGRRRTRAKSQQRWCAPDAPIAPAPRRRRHPRACRPRPSWCSRCNAAREQMNCKCRGTAIASATRCRCTPRFRRVARSNNTARADSMPQASHRCVWPIGATGATCARPTCNVNTAARSRSSGSAGNCRWRWARETRLSSLVQLVARVGAVSDSLSRWHRARHVCGVVDASRRGRPPALRSAWPAARRAGQGAAGKYVVGASASRRIRMTCVSRSGSARRRGHMAAQAASDSDCPAARRWSGCCVGRHRCSPARNPRDGVPGLERPPSAFQLRPWRGCRLHQNVVQLSDHYVVVESTCRPTRLTAKLRARARTRWSASSRAAVLPERRRHEGFKAGVDAPGGTTPAKKRWTIPSPATRCSRSSP